jgi:hypothetical protein
MNTVFLVELNYGFSGEKWFLFRDNAEKFAKKVDEKVQEVNVTALEKYNIDFEDYGDERDPFIEKINVPFNVIQ